MGSLIRLSVSEIESIHGESRRHFDFPGYLFCADGTMWSCRLNSGKEDERYHHLQGSPCPAGRPSTMIRNAAGKYKSVRICRLVAEAFLGPRPAGMEVCHFPDRNPANNRIENLRFGTRKENAADKIVHGTMYEGERHCSSKLSAESVGDIRRLYSQGRSKRSLAKEFGVCRSSIAKIVSMRSWKRASPEPLGQTARRGYA